MPKARNCSVLIIIVILSLSTGVCSYANGPPIVYLYPDSTPVHVNLFFPAGSPLERFTGQKDAWYAIYQTSLYPGYAYTILIRHNGDPDRMKLYAMDNHPFDKVSVKTQLAMKRVDSAYPSYKETSYEAVVSLPERARFADLFLLLEWLPATGNDRPLPVSMQVVSTGYGQLMGRGRQWGQLDSWRPESSMQGRRPVVIPFPER
ncbi:MAG: hypothetical protein H6Q52_132 [Deltaproteobacteria bacterium]|nr:hypothetical protein [Deltaproteobacteria bacterium]